MFIAAEHDRITPASLNYDNFKKYKISQAPTKYSLTLGSSHLPNDRFWKTEAEVILNWLKSID
ncbi:MAG: hypothetical protein MH321_14635 [Leptospiraceae bacterium]|nr:hypothetical protein [Leptospiraceae bacterium]